MMLGTLVHINEFYTPAGFQCHDKKGRLATAFHSLLYVLLLVLFLRHGNGNSSGASAGCANCATRLSVGRTQQICSCQDSANHRSTAAKSDIAAGQDGAIEEGIVLYRSGSSGEAHITSTRNSWCSNLPEHVLGQGAVDQLDLGRRTYLIRSRTGAGDGGPGDGQAASYLEDPHRVRVTASIERERFS